MPEQNQSIERSRAFHALHAQNELLLLPNAWDPFGARVLQSLGYPAVATASAAMAFSLGFDDGERLRFETLLEGIRRMAESISIPLTADIERGYARDTETLERHVEAILDAGVAGVNFEDSDREEGQLRELSDQCRRIEIVRKVADRKGIPLFLNARCDCLLDEGGQPSPETGKELIRRGQAYREAGADGFYPILLNDLPLIEEIVDRVQLPVNVLFTPQTPDREQLLEVGVRRLSFGPGWFKVAAHAMHHAAEQLLHFQNTTAFVEEALPGEIIRNILSDERENGGG